MHPKEFITQLDEARIVAAIAAAESRSSGQIRVYMSRKRRADALAYAQRRFAALGMTKTRQRNGVLIYLAPRTRQFAVVGDLGVHEKCGDAFWREVAAAMSDLMRQNQFTEAILHGITRVGDLLAAHFPHDPDAPDELPDEIIRD
jgi:uncharacterized membrane protein